jgi:hypothetical protein
MGLMPLAIRIRQNLNPQPAESRCRFLPRDLDLRQRPAWAFCSYSDTWGKVPLRNLFIITLIEIEDQLQSKIS